MSKGWIKIHRKIMDWEWWDDVATRNVFLYLLLKANHEDGTWKGTPVKRGQLITSRSKIAKECGIEEQPARRSLNNLQNSQQITIKSTSRFSIITINNYDCHQQNTSEPTSQATNKQPANQPQTRSKEDKKKENISKDISAEAGVETKKRKDIDSMLIALKQTIGIEAFVDSRIERNMAKHCLGLLEKIGREEFKFRLASILDDDFLAKNCNKIKFVYNNIKGFKPKQTAVNHYSI
jgi:hypothetical protein